MPVPYFPSSVATALQLYTAKNNLKVILDVSVTSLDTTIQVDDASNLPASGWITFVNTNECVYYSSKTSNQLLGCTRGADGTTAVAHGAGEELEMRWNAAYHNDLATELIAVESWLNSYFGPAVFPLLAPDGTVGAPTYTWAADPDTGIYRYGSGVLGIAGNGVLRARIGLGGIQVDSGTFTAPDGSAASPTVVFSGSVNSGLFLKAVGQVGIATSGLESGYFDSNGLYLAGKVATGAGTAAAPSHTFTAETITGMYRASAGVLGFSAGGIQIATISSAGLSVVFGSIIGQSLQLTATANQIWIGSPNSFIITATAPPANRFYTLPDTLTNSSFIMSDLAQTLNGVKTFTSGIPITATTNQLILGTTNTVTVTSPAPAAPRVYTIPDVLAAADFVMTEGNQTINGIKTFTGGGSFSLADGTVSAPSLFFTADTDCGIYRSATNSWNLVAGGVAVANIVDTYFNVYLQEFHPNGSPTVPSISFATDQDTGFYRVGADNLGVTIGGVLNLDIQSGQTRIGNTASDGSAASPVIRFASRNTGIYTDASSYLNVGIAGTARWTLNDTALLGATDNTYDIGASATAMRYGYFKTGIRYVETGTGTDYVQLEGPASVTSSYRVVLPDAAPSTIGYAMKVQSLGPPVVLEWGIAGGGGTYYFQKYTVGTASAPYTGSQTVFDLPFSYVADGKTIEVYYNGQQLVPTTDYTETSTTQITTTFALTNGATVWFRTVSSTTAVSAVTLQREDYVVGTASGNYTGSTTVFALLNTYNVAGKVLMVTVDGVVQTLGASADYLETNSSTVTFNNALVTGQRVSFLWANSTGTTGVNSGTANQIAYYAGGGNVVSGTSVATISGSNLSLNSNKIVSLANGTSATDAATFGQLYYGFQTPVQATSTTTFTTTLATFQATSLSASITPTSASHRIKITVTGTLRAANPSTGSAYATIARNGTDIASSSSGFMGVSGNLTLDTRVPASATYIDSPATTSSVTYDVRLRTDVAGQTVSWGSTGTQVIILEEIV